MIDVHIEDAHRLVRDLDGLNHLLQVDFEITAVIKTGQSIGQRHRERDFVIGTQAFLKPLAANLRTHPGQQFVPVERAHDIIMGADLKAVRDAWHIFFVAEHDDRRIPCPLIRAQMGTQAHPVFVLEVQRHDNQFEIMLWDELQGSHPAGGRSGPCHCHGPAYRESSRSQIPCPR